MASSQRAPLSVNAIPTLAYWRRSSDQQEASIPQQQSWGLDTCARDNLSLVGEEFDDAISGSEIKGRDGLLRLIALASDLFRKGTPARRLLVWKANRLSRADSCATHALVIQPLRDAGILHVQTQDGRLIDLFNRNDLLLFNIEQDASNAAYLSSLASDVLRGKQDLARQGFWNGGPIPLGYRGQRTADLKGKRRLTKLILGPSEEVDLVRWIFRTYLETRTSCQQIARELNRKGIKPPRAKVWSENGVHSIIVNRVYLGEVVWNARHQGKFARVVGGLIVGEKGQAREEDRRRKGLKDLPTDWNEEQDKIVCEGAHEAIIGLDVFSAVQEKLSSQAGRTSVRETRFYELADLMTCGHCGEKCWCIPNTTRKRPAITRVHCSRHRNEGAEACPQSATEHHSEVLRRVLAILQRDLGGEDVQEAIRQELKRRVKESAGNVAGKIQGLAGAIKTLETRVAKEARRLLELPSSVLPTATAAHEDTLRDLAQARGQLAAVENEQAINPAALDVAERALGMVKKLPKIASAIADLQARADRGDKSVEATELLTIRRSLRNVLFALVKNVRLTFRPMTAAQRQGRGKTQNASALQDVEVILHPHVQEALLHDVAKGTATAHYSLNCNAVGPIVLSFNRPFAA